MQQRLSLPSSLSQYLIIDFTSNQYLLDKIVLGHNAANNKLLASEYKLGYPNQANEMIGVENFQKKAIVVLHICRRFVVDRFAWIENFFNT